MNSRRRRLGVALAAPWLAFALLIPGCSESPPPAPDPAPAPPPKASDSRKPEVHSIKERRGGGAPD